MNRELVIRGKIIYRSEVFVPSVITVEGHKIESISQFMVRDIYLGGFI